MTKVVVIEAFYDLVDKVERAVGDVIEAREARLEVLLGENEHDKAFVAYTEKSESVDQTAETESVDWSKKKADEIKAELVRRGVEVPKGAKKDDLLALLD